MISAVGNSLLRPFAAAALTLVVVALPILWLGEASDSEARARARAEMFASGAGVAQRMALILERKLTSLQAWQAVDAAGGLRAAMVANDRAGICTAAFNAFRHEIFMQSGFTFTRAVVTDANGTVLAEVTAADSCDRPTTSGQRDQAAIDLIAVASRGSSAGAPGNIFIPGGLPFGSTVGEPFLRAVGTESGPAVAVATLVIPSDGSRTPIGLLYVELPVRTLQVELPAALEEAEDVYVVDRAGRFLLSAHPVDGARPLVDLSSAAIVKKALRQPVLQTSGSLKLREEAVDPFSGELRPFATAVLERLGWQIFAVPDQGPMRALESSLTALRAMRLALALALIAGAFVVAAGARAIARQRAALAAANIEIAARGAELEAATRHKSEFLANMSHELRTPLNAIIGFSDVLAQKFFGELNAKQAEYVGDINTSGRHLLDLVNEILDLSKVEAGRMELEPSEFAIAETVRGALAFVRERAARQGVALGADVPTDLRTIVADERKIRQVLLNLLSNAVKFTPDGGTIGVTARQIDGELIVSVRDTGIGISPDDQLKVFEEFQQVGKPTDRSREGTGLGLTLAKRFVELHGGRIWLESAVGKGTTFTFTVPAPQTSAVPALA